MSGFPMIGTDRTTPVHFAPPPKGEPVFVFIQDDSSDGQESRVVTTATLDWVREQFHDYLQGDRETGVDYETAYVLVEGTEKLQRCHLGTGPGQGRGDGPRLMVYNGIGVIAMYDL